jgi:hypothetical protein
LSLACRLIVSMLVGIQLFTLITFIITDSYYTVFVCRLSVDFLRFL